MKDPTQSTALPKVLVDEDGDKETFWIVTDEKANRIAAYDPETGRKVREWKDSILTFDLHGEPGKVSGVCEVCKKHQAILSYRPETNRMECLSCIVQRAIDAENALHELDLAIRGKGSCRIGDGVFRNVSMRENAIKILTDTLAHRKDLD